MEGIRILREVQEKKKIKSEKSSKMLSLHDELSMNSTEITNATAGKDKGADEILQLRLDQRRLCAEIEQATDEFCDACADYFMAQKAYDCYQQYLSNVFKREDARG